MNIISLNSNLVLNGAQSLVLALVKVGFRTYGVPFGTHPFAAM